KLLSEKVKTECYATDAVLVTEQLFDPLQRKYPKMHLLPERRGAQEVLHDCISMVRVVPMSVFDEKQYLGAGIRRRMKEKYHVLSEEVKRKKPFHIFLVTSEEKLQTPSLFVAVTDENLSVTEEVRMDGSANEEQTAARLCDILLRYPEADILTDRTEEKLYGLFRNMYLFMNVKQIPVLYSMTGMLTALGKDVSRILSSVKEEVSEQACFERKTGDASEPALREWIYLYRTYIKNAEAARLGCLKEDTVVERLYFYLPVRISSEQDFRKQFRKNNVWKQVGDGAYEIDTTGEIRAKYTIKAGEEQFVLRVSKISIRRYLREYAVFELETENRCYPGLADREHIRQLGACLFLRQHTDRKIPGEKVLPDLLELKIKTKDSAYALSAFALPKEAGWRKDVWLNGLFLLGRKKSKKAKKGGLRTETCSEQMFVSRYHEDTFRIALVRDEYLSSIEEELAQAAAPKHTSDREGKLTCKKRRQIRKLYEAFRYLAVSFGEEERKTAEGLVWSVEKQCGTDIKTERLTRKFDYYR
ncbi:MAG: hypothetical protein ACI4FZ_02190, partial [Lachnospiraceae bacterium]